MTTQLKNQCKRCGTCCEKGGPSLHQEDRALVENGHIPGRFLFTIRQGELARDNVKGLLVPVTSDIIKIRGKADSWTCIFYDEETRRCGIYAHRPLECRALNCRDTQRIEAVYQITRLTRRDLLSDIQGLWDLIEDHEQRCSYDLLGKWVGEGIINGRFRQSSSILESIRYDTHVRQLAAEKGGMDARMLDFIFGRPLSETIKMFDIKLVKKKGNRLYRQVNAIE